MYTKIKDDRDAAFSKIPGKSSSLQRLKSKASHENLSKKLIPKKTSLVNSQKALKKHKFDTPEKKISPIKHLEPRLVPKKVPPPKDIPFPSKIILKAKKEISFLISKGQQEAKTHINPLLFTPVLITRKRQSEEKTFVSRSQTPQYKLQANVFDSPAPELLKKPQETQVQNPETLFYYNKLVQPSFGEPSELPKIESLKSEDEDPTFLSERQSNDCESNQSLSSMHKQDFDKFQFKESFESSGSSRYKLSEKLDCETQTETNPLEKVFSLLDDSEIKQGIKFISQIARFIKYVK